MKHTDNLPMTTRWKPNTTVAAVIEQHGKFLLVEERTPTGLKLNNPAGHLDEGENLVQACVRETLEETMYAFEPTHLLGIYSSRVQRQSDGRDAAQDITYLRFAFCGCLGVIQHNRKLDHGIARTLWLTADEIRASTARHRSPMLLRGVEDYLSGRRFPLDLIHTDLSVTAPKATAP